MVREEIGKLIEKAIKELGYKVSEILVEQPRGKEYGDCATNVAMVTGKESMRIAEMIKSRIKSSIIEKIEIVKPGFINFFISKEYLQKQVGEILKEKEKFGQKIHPVKLSRFQRDTAKGGFNRVNIEFISANPTGPLTLGNGRGGFCGDVLANVFKKAGYKICREYYINDRGKQIEALKKGFYKGEKRTALQIQKENQKFITKKLKIKFDVWFSEKNLYKNKEVDKILNWLKKKKLAYEKDGALWFKSTEFRDDKDRVLVKADGEKTYFASDIAYLKNKFERGFDKLIFFWGADHYGYIARLKAAAEALGYKKEQLTVVLMQLVKLFKEGQEFKMSKRTGNYVGLEELIDEVGLDVARFFFLTRSPDSHLNFDMDLAKEQSEKNPVYYVQYAYARVSSILRKAQNNFQFSIFNFQLLNHPSELNLIKQLIRFPEIIEDTAKDFQVQRIPQYVVQLADAFHQFYENCRVISEDKELSKARFALISATKIVLKNTLDLLGISAPEKMR
ncbi:MAG: arginine--tRNA ligase [Candidatus Nealsonbacteria bacterium CG10_big_fil_rev_8_21_14_0_10_36_24]|uniref:Arginine--tRNA ligase n=2 Tax=Candidatus Nealsoniibacteriota TaxID=1817911 RepID=A0A2H0YPR3_9BACT|nr:MAG: arginine--tRNA ligase [Candidatus Nealsonbacteria bacterium CG10_big_fil_rev_8_21_14_0_10_36_24]PIS40269.1 MAG: arginine--tRNA ligase [Candidatus Nealsonbacteria bacterium CG08_land_8_20_14_0_20_36_22]